MHEHEQPHASAFDLIRAIQIDPLAESPRLAYAIWLEQHGQAERALAVRLGAARCRTGRSDDHDDVQSRNEIDTRLRRLSKHEGDWAEDLPVISGIHWDKRSVGGLFQRIYIGDVEAFRREAGRVFDAGPVISIGFSQGGRNVAPDLATLEAAFASPEMERMGGLATLGVRHGSTLLEAIAGSESLRNLKVLRLWLEAIDDAGAEAIARTDRLGTLRELDLHGNALTSTGCQALASAAHLALCDLNLADNEIDSSGATALANALWSESLRCLDLSNNEIGPEGAEALAKCPRLSHLTRLDLKGNAIGPRGASALFESEQLAELSHLSLTVTPPGSGALIRPGTMALKNLRVLLLSGKLIGGPGALGPPELSSILDEPCMSSLRVLGLFNNPLGDAGASAVARAGHMTALQSLDFTKTGIGDAGAIVLAHAEHLRNLERLALGINQIGDAGALAIAGSVSLQSLKKLIVGVNPISPAAHAQLKARFGDRVDDP